MKYHSQKKLKESPVTETMKILILFSPYILSSSNDAEISTTLSTDKDFDIL